MKNLIGFFLKIVSVFSIFFIIFSSPVNASSLSTSSSLQYLIKDDGKTEYSVTINIKNTSKLPSVVNYYNVFLPFEKSSDIKVVGNKKNLDFTKHEQKTGVEIVADLDRYVIGAKQEYVLKISGIFNPEIGKGWEYVKLPTKIADLNIKSALVKYSTSKPKPSWFSDSRAKYSTDTNNRIVTIENPTDSEISFMFGDTQTYKFEINKTYINYDSQEKIYDIILPKTQYNQLFIISQISPLPEFVKIDEDKNILLGIKVKEYGQEEVVVSGYIQMVENEEPQLTNIFEDSTGYWMLSDQKEIARLNQYLKGDTSNLPEKLNAYVISRLQMKELNKDSIENILRGGVPLALKRTSRAIPEDYSDLLIALFRYFKIPSRMVFGYIPISSIYTSNGFYHSWVEYYDTDFKSWKSLDPALEDILDINFQRADFKDHIALITRETNAITPKFPYFNQEELSIYPSLDELQYIFDVTEHNGIVKNEGNGIVIIKTRNTSGTLLPNQEIEIQESGDVLISDLVGDEKRIEIDNEVFEISSINIFVELLLFTAFLGIIVVIVWVYGRMKKVWKPTQR